MDSLPFHPLGRKDRPQHRSTSSNHHREPRAHPEQAYRSCLGILRLDKHYPKERLENAAARALRFSNLSLKALRKILENGLDRLEDKDSGSTAALPAHDNIRGGQYYH